MFCPKCGSSLTVGARGNFECPQGLEFSVDLSRRLREHFPDAGSADGGVRLIDGHHPWYCPGCGGRTSGGEPPCRCGRRMTPVMFHYLIELHPHPDGRGGYF